MGKKSKRKTGKKKGSSGGGGGSGSSGGDKAAATNTNDDEKILDKKCDARMAELQYVEETNQGKELQFSVGDRVLCKVSRNDIDDLFDEDDFATLSIKDMIIKSLARRIRHVKLPGTIVHLWYCNPGKKNVIYPYQIRLDEDDRLIYAESETSVIKSDLPPPRMTSSDELLFAQPPHREDCPICMIPLPLQQTQQTRYFSCCGKVICLGCIVHSDEVGLKEVCPFCRAPEVFGKEDDERVEKRIKSNDPEAMLWSAALLTQTGKIQDRKKSIQLTAKAAELGLCSAHYNLGNAYKTGDCIEKNLEKAMFHWGKAAIAGHGGARFNLGNNSCYKQGDLSFLSMKHFMIGAKSGYGNCLHGVKQGFVSGMITKTDFEETLHMHNESLKEMSSEQRNKAAASKSA